MEYEIDFMPVGDGKKSGDAITLRFGNLTGPRTEQAVVVIDGGTKESGEKLVEHIRKYYLTDEVDLVISSHPDADHSSGLTEVLENLTVKHLWIHKPWEHAHRIGDYCLTDKTPTAIENKIRKALDNARELVKIAEQKGVPINEPFSDSSSTSDAIVVLSPSKDFYEALLPNYRCLSEEIEQPTFLEGVIKSAKEIISFVVEAFNIETLEEPDDNATSAENNSSTVLLFQVGNDKLLFTADTGVLALTEAVNKASSLGIDLRSANFIQIPHHGSRRNVGPSILNRIIGPILPSFQKRKTAFVSASKDGGPKHPSKKVANAFHRRGAEVHGTQGISKLHHSAGSPSRNWGKSIPLPFFDQVEHY